MRTSRNSSLWIGALVLASVCVLAVWRVTQSRSSGKTESASREDLAAAPNGLERGEVTAAASAANIGSADELAREPAVESHTRRIDVERTPASTGLRQTHAQVFVVGSVDSGERHPERTRVQVFADSDETELCEGASGSVLVNANADATFVADVTNLFIGVQTPPKRLRIVAKTELGCVATVDRSVGHLLEDLAKPGDLAWIVDVSFRCTRMVKGRVIAPNAVGDVHVELEQIRCRKNVKPIKRSVDVAHESGFELPTVSIGDFRVIASAAVHGPRIVEFSVESLDGVNLGDILLPEATCSGTARFCGEILANTMVTAVPVGARSNVASVRGVGSVSALLRFELAAGGIAFGSSVYTDDHGRFEFDLLSPGAYVLSFEPSGCRTVDLVPPSFEVPARNIELDVRACVLEIEFVLEHASQFRKEINVEFQLAVENARRISFKQHDNRWSKAERIAIPLGVAATLTANGERFDIAPCRWIGTHPMVIELGRGRR